MQMAGSSIFLLLGSSFRFAIILYKTKCQPPALRDGHMCPVTINSFTSGKIFCFCDKLLSQNTMTEGEIIHYMSGLVLPVDMKLSLMSVVLSCSQHSNVAVKQEQQIYATPESSISSRCAIFGSSAR